MNFYKVFIKIAKFPKYAKLPKLTLSIRLALKERKENLMENMIMTTATATEQRNNERTDIAWPVSVWMPEVNRFFNGQTSNVSKGGAYFRVPITMPVREGNIIEVNFPRTEALAKDKGQYARIKCGKVVRVERRNILTEADMGVAVIFE